MKNQINSYEDLYSCRFNHLKMKTELLRKYDVLNYLENLEMKLYELLEILSKYNFWLIFPKILGIDSKLTIIEEFIETDYQISEIEIIKMAETDYKHINKENFGYRLEEGTPNSMIFYVD